MSEESAPLRDRRIRAEGGLRLVKPEYHLPHWSQFLGINFRRVAWFIIIGVALAFFGWQGFLYLQAQRRAHLATLTQGFLKQGDFRSAALSARQTLKENPNDLTALKIMAVVADRNGSPAAVLWWARIAQLEPQRAENQLKWAASALRLNQVPVASQALSNIGGSATNSVRYQELAGATALAAGRFAEAEKHLAEAVRLEPANLSQFLNLAVVQLQSPDPTKAAAARLTLTRLQSDETLRVRAQRTLIADAKRRSNAVEALPLARSVIQDKQATFADHLHYLTLLHLTKAPDFNSELERIMKRSAARAEEVSPLAAWMRQHDLARDALAWLRSLPADIRDVLPIPIAVAECHVQLRSWEELESWLQKQTWEELEFLRFAFLARALRELNRPDSCRATWKQAVSAVGAEVQKQAMLARLADGWQWAGETEQLWWMIAMGDTDQRPALATLNRLYTQRQDERMLLRVAARSYNLNTRDLFAKNNYALLSLLMKHNTGEAFLLAKENFREHPGSSVFRSTYAFALYQQGHVQEALEVFSAIPKEKLDRPALTAYFGILLAANGRKEEALAQLDRAEKANVLMPSEKRLVAEARASLR